MPNRARQIIPFPAAPARPNFSSARKSKHSKKQKKVVWLVCALLVVFLAAAGTQLVRQEIRMRQLMLQQEELLERQRQLQSNNESLQNQIQRLLDDPTYLEQLARQMGMVKPDDTIYIKADPEVLP
jgi:cell division protein FtsB